MEMKDINIISQEQLLIDKINLALKELGSTAKWKRAPERLEGIEILKDKTIVMVDDEQGLLEAFVPYLTMATDGKAAFIKYNGQSVEELVSQIQQAKADLVLLDYHLSEVLKGSTVTSSLLKDGFGGFVIGFSSDPNTKRDFQKSGAFGSVSKETWSPESSVKKIAELLESK